MTLYRRLRILQQPDEGAVHVRAPRLHQRPQADFAHERRGVAEQLEEQGLVVGARALGRSGIATRLQSFYLYRQDFSARRAH